MEGSSGRDLKSPNYGLDRLTQIHVYYMSILPTQGIWGATTISRIDRGDKEALGETWVIIEELSCFNQSLESNILTLQVQYHEYFHVEDEVLDP